MVCLGACGACAPKHTEARSPFRSPIITFAQPQACRERARERRDFRGEGMRGEDMWPFHADRRLLKTCATTDIILGR